MHDSCPFPRPASPEAAQAAIAAATGEISDKEAEEIIEGAVEAEKPYSPQVTHDFFESQKALAARPQPKASFFASLAQALNRLF